MAIHALAQATGSTTTGISNQSPRPVKSGRLIEYSLTSHSTLNRSYRRHSSQPILRHLTWKQSGNLYYNNRTVWLSVCVTNAWARQGLRPSWSRA